jgi:hypothetical protein
MLSQKSKDKINKAIFERAYEIEQILSADDFLFATIAGIGKDPIAISEHALNISVKELQKTINS